ncbi:hypothetical protein BOX15_Mlig033396g2 [Macrostomum lignano]|uniref:WSC domain-containing protein n=1 Tax=Macrostomum lignano TaxID=282301 RepID=A0A267DT83_9PLAT|nr:hypothetical protein BOX15_Mlig033396g2 [Macrostomum lignano]
MWAHKLLLLALIPIFGSFEADAALTRPDWNYIGCFRNTAVDFAKVQPSSAVKMTREVCRSECIRRGKTFFGLSGGAECSCSDLFQKKDEKDAWFCKLRCEGDSSQTCGGPDFTDVFQAYNLLVPKMPAQRIGCFPKDGYGSFRLTQRAKNRFMTHEYCANVCLQTKSKYFGLSDTDTCSCARSNTTEVYESTDCGWRCRGNYAEDCGADSSVAVFKLEEMYV